MPSRPRPLVLIIAAQMWGKLWGLIAPGLPKVAAEYAAHNVSLTHPGNGLHAGLFIAALASVAMVESILSTIL